MPLPDPKSHKIPLNQAAVQTKRSHGKGNKGGFFFRKDLDELLAQPGCSGVRYYYGLDENGKDSLVMVGVDKDGNDMTSGVLMELSFPCPPYCGDGNALNS